MEIQIVDCSDSSYFANRTQQPLTARTSERYLLQVLGDVKRRAGTLSRTSIYTWIEGLAIRVTMNAWLHDSAQKRAPFSVHHDHDIRPVEVLGIYSVCALSAMEIRCAIEQCQTSARRYEFVSEGVEVYADLPQKGVQQIVVKTRKSVDYFLLDRDPDLIELAASRAMRTAFVSAAREHGNCLHLHASAVHSSRRTYVFVGNTGSGKTTLMASALDRGYHFIANDDCLVFESGSAAGVPVSVGLRGPTLQGIPRLRALLNQAAQNIHRPMESVCADRRTITVDELCRLLGVDMCISSMPSDVVFLEPAPSAVSVQLSELDRRLAPTLLSRHVHPTPSEHQPWCGPATCSGKMLHTVAMMMDVRFWQARYPTNRLPELAAMLL